jgi:hypothetical protein
MRTTMTTKLAAAGSLAVLALAGAACEAGDGGGTSPGQEVPPADGGLTDPGTTDGGAGTDTGGDLDTGGDTAG